MRLPEKLPYLCPHCDTKSLLLLNQTPQDYDDAISVRLDDGKVHDALVTMQHNVYRCVNCAKDTYILLRGPAKVLADDGRSSNVAKVIAELPPEIVHHYPVPTPSVHEAVPEDVKRASVEAEKCFCVGAYNACGVMTRRAMHCLCSEKKAEGKDLFEQLKYLKDNHLITPDLWKWAEELRIVGRSGAHPEWQEVSKEEAEYALRFLREIVRYVYINPAERETRRLKETKKKL